MADSNIGPSLAIFVGHLKNIVAENLVTSRNKGTFDVKDSELKRVIDVINLSLDQGMTSGYSQIEQTFKRK